MPSYVGRVDGKWIFGTEAINLGVNVHSIKPKLVEDLELPELPGFRASDAALALLTEVVQRTIKYLHAQRLLPTTVDTLTVATQLGATPRFRLDARVRLRDIARQAGIDVRLSELVEEPVAAAFELIYGGTIDDGRLMVVDVGGGTVDIAVIRSDLGSSLFEVFGTRGADIAGDRFTEVLVERLAAEVALRTVDAKPLTARSSSLLWLRAEQAKRTLDGESRAVVGLGGIGGLEAGELVIERDWYQQACRPLQKKLEREIREAYLLARLVLDRGGPDDPAPGTLNFHQSKAGVLTRLTDESVSMSSDASKHLDAVVAVGGGSLSPLVRDVLKQHFEGQLKESSIDPIGAIALGLARGQRLTVSNLRYPNWGISATFDEAEGASEVPFYEPFAPTMARSARSSWYATAEYSYERDVPPNSKTVTLVFHPIDERAAVPWPPIALPPGIKRLRLDLDLFGRVNLVAIGSTPKAQTPLLIGRAELKAPWMPEEGTQVGPWIPAPKDPDWFKEIPMWDWTAVG